MALTRHGVPAEATPRGAVTLRSQELEVIPLGVLVAATPLGVLEEVTRPGELQEETLRGAIRKAAANGVEILLGVLSECMYYNLSQKSLLKLDIVFRGVYSNLSILCIL